MKSVALALALCVVFSHTGSAQSATVLVSNFGPGDTYNQNTRWVIGDTTNQAIGVSWVNSSGTRFQLDRFRFGAQWDGGANTLQVGFWGGSTDLNSATLLESFTFSAAAVFTPQIFTAVSNVHPSITPGGTYFITLSAPGAPEAHWGWAFNNQGQLGILARHGDGAWSASSGETPVFEVLGVPVSGYISTVVGLTATMIGGATGDALTITQAGGLFQHNRFTAGDPGFNSPFDFNTAVAGDQTLSATTGIININAGDGNDTIALGNGINVRGTIDGGPGTDTLDYTAYTTAVTANLGLGTTGLSGTLGPDQASPPTTHTATGTASVANYNIVNHTFDITVTVTGITPAEVTGFDIHQAAVGVSGPMIVDFVPLGGLTPVGSGFTFTKTGLTLPAANEAAFLGGGTYVNVHTAVFGFGAIRGQLFSTGNVQLGLGAATGTAGAAGAGGVANIENVTGGSGNDSLVGSFPVNTINGGAGADWIVGGPGSDTLNGGAGADVLVWSNGDGTDIDEGGTEIDTVQVNGNTTGVDVFVVGANGTRLRFDRTNVGPFSLDIGTVETLIVNGIGGADTFTVNDLTGIGSLSSLNLRGFDGDDTFAFVPAGASIASLNTHGGPGTDTLLGPNVASTWIVAAANNGGIVGLTAFSFIEALVGGTASDTFNVQAFASGTPAVNGGAGTDTLNYNAESRPVSGDITPPDGLIVSPGVQSVAFTQIETVNINNQLFVPGPPTNVSAVGGNAQATVTFTAPASNGGAAITSYTVTSSPGGVTRSGPSSPLTVTGLTNGTAYTFTVVATNSVGSSAPSSQSNSVTPATFPGPPTNVSAVGGIAQATITFTAPASSGGAAITSYTVTISPGGSTRIGTTSPLTVTGLTNGTAYTFAVVATNSVGSSAPSSASNSVTPATVPGPPTNVVAVRGNAQATVSFTGPASDGGAAITSYAVTASPGGATRIGTSGPLTVTGLTNGTAYTFTVVATNSVGSSAPSAPSNAVTPLMTVTVPNVVGLGPVAARAAITAAGLVVGTISAAKDPSVAPESVISQDPVVGGTLVKGSAVNLLVSSGRPLVSPMQRNDADGDGKSDLVVFRPSVGGWFIRNSSQNFDVATAQVFQWGLPGDVPIAADFDGDGKLDLSVFRPPTGEWSVRYSSQHYDASSPGVFQWGLPGDVPIAGDFDGDGKSELAVFRPSSGGWFIRNSSQGFDVATAQYFQWGLPGDVPIAADFDGDGKTDLTVFRPPTGEWFIRYSAQSYDVSTAGVYQWGLPGDVPLASDFDGDGKSELAVFRPSIGGWFVRNSSESYAIATASFYQWGLPGDVPIAADFDADGKTELVVFRPATGEWFICYSAQSYDASTAGVYQWGLPGDVPIKP